MIRTTVLSALALLAASSPLLPQTVEVERRDMAGPRLGFTFVTGSRAREKLDSLGMAPFFSQFGWHFEQQVVPRTRGPVFVIQEVFLLGAVEQTGSQRPPIPSLTLLMGIRMPSGWEFGLGPNVTPVGGALAMGIGRTLDYGGVSLPVNFAAVYSPNAYRFSLLVGYALRTARQPAAPGAGERRIGAGMLRR